MPTSTAGSSTKQAGFTLIELTVVVVILAMFALLTVPLFSSTGTNKLDYSGRRLSGTIKYLFNESALTGKEHRLIYNLDQGTYRGKIVEATGEIVAITGIGSESKLAGDVRFQDLQLPGRGTFTNGDVSVRFHPSGWVEEAGIHLEDGQNNKLTLHVMPLTGTCEILEGYKTL